MPQVVDVVSVSPAEDATSAAPLPAEDAASAAPAAVEDAASAAPPPAEDTTSAPPETPDATEPPDVQGAQETPDTTLVVASPDPLPTVNIPMPAYGGPPPESSRDLIQRIMKRHNGAIRACYENALKLDPTVKGQITIAWTINTKGEVEKPTAKTNTTGNKDLEACITKAVEKIRFPATDSPTQITYPFTFESP